MKAVKVLDRILEIATSVAFTGLIAVVCIQIMSRYLPYTAVWTEELSRYLFIYAIAFAAPLGIRRQDFIHVDLIFSLFSDETKKKYEGVIYGGVALFSAVVLIHSWSFIQLGIGFSSTTLAVDMSLFYASIGIMFFFLTIYSLLHMIDCIQANRQGSDNR